MIKRLSSLIRKFSSFIVTIIKLHSNLRMCMHFHVLSFSCPPYPESPLILTCLKKSCSSFTHYHLHGAFSDFPSRNEPFLPALGLSQGIQPTLSSCSHAFLIHQFNTLNSVYLYQALEIQSTLTEPTNPELSGLYILHWTGSFLEIGIGSARDQVRDWHQKVLRSQLNRNSTPMTEKSELEF